MHKKKYIEKIISRKEIKVDENELSEMNTHSVIGYKAQGALEKKDQLLGFILRMHTMLTLKKESFVQESLPC